MASEVSMDSDSDTLPDLIAPSSSAPVTRQKVKTNKRKTRSDEKIEFDSRTHDRRTNSCQDDSDLSSFSPKSQRKSAEKRNKQQGRASKLELAKKILSRSVSSNSEDDFEIFSPPLKVVAKATALRSRTNTRLSQKSKTDGKGNSDGCSRSLFNSAEKTAKQGDKTASQKSKTDRKSSKKSPVAGSTGRQKKITDLSQRKGAQKTKNVVDGVMMVDDVTLVDDVTVISSSSGPDMDCEPEPQTSSRGSNRQKGKSFLWSTNDDKRKSTASMSSPDVYDWVPSLKSTPSPSSLRRKSPTPKKKGPFNNNSSAQKTTGSGSKSPHRRPGVFQRYQSKMTKTPSPGRQKNLRSRSSGKKSGTKANVAAKETARRQLNIPDLSQFQKAIGVTTSKQAHAQAKLKDDVIEVSSSSSDLEIFSSNVSSAQSTKRKATKEREWKTKRSKLSPNKTKTVQKGSTAENKRKSGLGEDIYDWESSDAEKEEPVCSKQSEVHTSSKQSEDTSSKQSESNTSSKQSEAHTSSKQSEVHKSSKQSEVYKSSKLSEVSKRPIHRGSSPLGSDPVLILSDSENEEPKCTGKITKREDSSKGQSNAPTVQSDTKIVNSSKSTECDAQGGSNDRNVFAHFISSSDGEQNSADVTSDRLSSPVFGNRVQAKRNGAPQAQKYQIENEEKHSENNNGGELIINDNIPEPEDRRTEQIRCNTEEARSGSSTPVYKDRASVFDQLNTEFLKIKSSSSSVCSEDDSQDGEGGTWAVCENDTSKIIDEVLMRTDDVTKTADDMIKMAGGVTKMADDVTKVADDIKITADDASKKKPLKSLASRRKRKTGDSGLVTSNKVHGSDLNLGSEANFNLSKKTKLAKSQITGDEISTVKGSFTSQDEDFVSHGLSAQEKNPLQDNPIDPCAQTNNAQVEPTKTLGEKGAMASINDDHNFFSVVSTPKDNLEHKEKIQVKSVKRKFGKKLLKVSKKAANTSTESESDFGITEPVKRPKKRASLETVRSREKLERKKSIPRRFSEFISSSDPLEDLYEEEAEKLSHKDNTTKAQTFSAQQKNATNRWSHRNTEDCSTSGQESSIKESSDSELDTPVKAGSSTAFVTPVKAGASTALNNSPGMTQGPLGTPPGTLDSDDTDDEGTGFMASGRVKRIEDDKDDVYDDGRNYEYKPTNISLDEILSGSDNNTSHLNTDGVIYLDQKVEFQVVKSPDDRKVMLSRRQSVHVMEQDAPLYVESESEVKEYDPKAAKATIKKIKSEWREVIRPCTVEVKRLSHSAIDRIRKQLKIEPICVPLVFIKTEEVEVISETDMEMFPEDCESISSNVLSQSDRRKMSAHESSMSPEKMGARFQETKIGKNLSHTTTTTGSVLESDTIDIPSEFFGDVEEFVDASQSLFDEKTQAGYAVEKTKAEKQQVNVEGGENEATVAAASVTHENTNDKEDEKKIEENENKYEEKFDGIDSEEEKSEDGVESELDDVVSLRPDPDSEPEEDVEDLLNNSGDSEDVVDNVHDDVIKNDDVIDNVLRNDDVLDNVRENDDVIENVQGKHEVTKTRTAAKKEAVESETSQMKSENMTGQPVTAEEILLLLMDKNTTAPPEAKNVGASSSDGNTVAPSNFKRVYEELGIDLTDDAHDSSAVDLQPDDTPDSPSVDDVQNDDMSDDGQDSPTVDLLPDDAPDDLPDLLPDESDSDDEEDDDEWVHKSRIESASDETELSLLNEEAKMCAEEANANSPSTNLSESAENSHSQESNGKRRRSQRNCSKLSLSARKKGRVKDSEDLKSYSGSQPKKPTTKPPSPLAEEDQDQNPSKNSTQRGKKTEDGKSVEKIENAESAKLAEFDDVFQIPLSQKSNGFTIETTHVCDVKAETECEDGDDESDADITLSQMPVLVESSDDEEIVIKTENETVLSEVEYQSLFVISSDDESEAGESRERRLSGYGSDLEITGEEKGAAGVIVKEEGENNDEFSTSNTAEILKENEKCPNDGKVPTSSAGEILKTNEKGAKESTSADNICEESDKKSEFPEDKNEDQEEEKMSNKEKVDLVDEKTVSNVDEKISDGFVKHNINLSEMADDEVRKFLDGAFLSQTPKKLKSFEDDINSSDDGSFEDIEGDFLLGKIRDSKSNKEALKPVAPKYNVKDKETPVPVPGPKHVEGENSSDELEREDVFDDFLSSKKTGDKKRQQKNERSTEEKDNTKEKSSRESVQVPSVGKSKVDDAPVKKSVTVISSDSDDSVELADDSMLGADTSSRLTTPVTGTLGNGSLPGTTKSRISSTTAKRAVPETTDSDSDAFVSIPSTSFYKKTPSPQDQRTLSKRAHAPVTGRGAVKKPTALLTGRDMRKEQRLRSGLGRGSKTSFQIQSGQIARAREQLMERQHSLHKEKENTEDVKSREGDPNTKSVEQAIPTIDRPTRSTRSSATPAPTAPVRKEFKTRLKEPAKSDSTEKSKVSKSDLTEKSKVSKSDLTEKSKVSKSDSTEKSKVSNPVSTRSRKILENSAQGIATRSTRSNVKMAPMLIDAQPMRTRISGGKSYKTAGQKNMAQPSEDNRELSKDRCSSSASKPSKPTGAKNNTNNTSDNSNFSRSKSNRTVTHGNSTDTKSVSGTEKSDVLQRVPLTSIQPKAPVNRHAMTGKAQPSNRPFRDGAAVALMNTSNISESLIRSIITRWSPKWFEECGSANRAPPIEQNLPKSMQALYPLLTKYSSMDDYLQIMVPLLLVEIWEMCCKSWKSSTPFRKKFQILPCQIKAKTARDGSKDANLSTMFAQGKFHSRDMSKAPGDGDLVVVHIKVTDKKLVPEGVWPVLAIVEKIHWIKTKDKKALNPKLGEMSNQHVAANLLLDLPVKRSSVFNFMAKDEFLDIEVVDSLVSSIRSLRAMLEFNRSPLAKYILTPPESGHVFHHTQQPKRELLAKFNPSQATTVASVSDAMLQPPVLKKIALILGPPGTGKTYTIQGLIRAVLSAETCDRKRPRILLCTPSNGAVDEVVRRLLNDQDFKGSKARWKLLRVGRVESMHPVVQKACLDKVVERDLTRFVSMKKFKDANPSVKAELKSLAEKIEKLTKTGKTEEVKKLQKKEKQMLGLIDNYGREINRARYESEFRAELLRGADVICCTLNYSASSQLDILRNGAHFTCCIIDEASQCTEMDCLIPLSFGMSKLTLVGDPNQLPPTVLSTRALNCNFGQSLFSRLYKFYREDSKGTNPTHFLDTQYRMHEEIVKFPSKHVYHNKLRTFPEVAKKRKGFPNQPYKVFNVQYGREETGKKPGQPSVANRNEAEFVVSLCEYLTQNKVPASNIGIITPYREQKAVLETSLRKRNLNKLEVRTVDGFQGQETDVIIISCVRAQGASGGIGFLADPRRMNVALTRAKYACYVVGHLKSLRCNEDWKALIADAEERQVLVQVPSAQDVTGCIKSALLKT